MLDRASANHELILFLEHVPHVLHPWLLEHPGSIDAVLDNLRVTVNFLRKHGIIHFDAHFHNILTDGERPYLTDFGLVLDKSFTLTDAELGFFKANTHYDYGEVLSCLGYVLYSAYEALPEAEQCQLKAKYGVEDGAQGHDLMLVLLANIEKLQVDSLLKLDERDAACMVRYRDIIALMQNFYSELSRNAKKDTKFPHAELRRRLKQTGFP
jgi:serine/threonine protein kinase